MTTDSEGVKTPKKRGQCLRKTCICFMVVLVVILCTFAGMAGYWVTKIIDSFNNAEKYALNMQPYHEAGTKSEIKMGPSMPVDGKLRHSFGYDKMNRPVIFVDFGKWDLGALAKDREGIQFVIRTMDKVQKRLQRAMPLGNTNSDNAVKGWVFVANMDGFTLAKAVDYRAIGLLQEIVKRHYQFLDKLEYGFVINLTPWIRLLERIFKPVFGNLFDRLEFYGADGWRVPTVEKIPASQIPMRYNL